ncbi:MULTISPECIES: hypothetical protein [Enterocloster]|uniref:DNA polymerase-4 n=1 Tax=Enterocloster lavalensis TaxID=460384 RepID=A0A1I0CMN0_9FIRM|nr:MULTISPECIES: hypothetical protein [Enterocloster]MDR3757588.1 DNA polymerase IV [Enterocloster sp.]SET20748.1 DNA polymerase-4 [Enterocloster lavalensis]
MSGVYFHIDVNSAYLSWTAAKRLVDGNPQDIRRIPAVIGGDESSRHGIVLAGSLPAKALGIRTGEPLIVARRRAPGLLILPPDYGLYAQCSRALMELLSQFSPDVFQYSIDEAFIDMSRSVRLFGSPLTAAETIRSRVREELGFTVNIGISSNKLLAKMASDFRKPDRYHTLFPEEIPLKMWPLPVSSLFFAGPAARRKLQNLGIRTIGELARTDRALLTAHLKNQGRVLWEYANGFDTSPYLIPLDRNKGFGNSMTMPMDVGSPEQARQFLLFLSETVSARIRADQAKISCVSLSLVDCNFSRCSCQETLARPTDLTEPIYQAACRLLRRAWDKTPLRKLGVHTSRVVREECSQLTLFPPGREEKLRRLELALDQIRAAYGSQAVTRGCFLNERPEKPPSLSIGRPPDRSSF